MRRGLIEWEGDHDGAAPVDPTIFRDILCHDQSYLSGRFYVISSSWKVRIDWVWREMCHVGEVCHVGNITWQISRNCCLDWSWHRGNRSEMLSRDLDAVTWLQRILFTPRAIITRLFHPGTSHVSLLPNINTCKFSPTLTSSKPARAKTQLARAKNRIARVNSHKPQPGTSLTSLVHHTCRLLW